MKIAGIDGCRAGWLRLESSDDVVTAKIFRNATEMFRDAESFAVLAIDIPIGLPEEGCRAVDTAARKFIQPRGSSVFPAPVRATLVASDYADACARSVAACGKSLSRQAFAILPKIREVDEALRERPELRTRVREVHPEVSFRSWNGAPLMEPKKTGFGFVARLKLVESAFAGASERVRREVPRNLASDDDILDAFAALWTANRIVAGQAITLPNATPPIDSAGLPMQMLV